MKNNVLDTRQKALEINLDHSIYGSFGEIGAGQEISRLFFQAGGASGTIAKSLSAYDMHMSDAVYGKRPGRYVSKARLEQMLKKEYSDLMTQIAKSKPDKRYFAICNTVEAINYDRSNKSHGWMGVKFQLNPGEQANTVIIHIRLLDRENIQQQQILGILGVNLLYGCYHLHHDPKTMLTHLNDNLIPGRMQIDMIEMNGPLFEKVDNRLLSLFLVKTGMADACLFQPDGSNIHPTEVLYKRDILALRGRFRPVTKVHLDMLKNGLRQFIKDDRVKNKDKITMVTELTMRDLGGKEGLTESDFLDRIDLLTALGQTVLISNFHEYYKLVQYFTRYNTGAQLALILGANSMINIFNEKHYKNLSGGVLASFGELFHRDVRLYLYPYKFGSEIINSKNMIVPKNLQALYKHLVDNKMVVDYENYDENILHIFSNKVLEKIRDNDKDWEKMVPPIVSRIIKSNNLFNWKKTKFKKVVINFDKMSDEN
jgi:hypothetical protein